MILFPGAMEAGLSDARFWLPLLGGFAIAWPFAFAANRAMIRRGTAHAVVHEYHHGHGDHAHHGHDHHDPDEHAEHAEEAHAHHHHH